MQLLIAILILIGSAALAVFEILIIPFVVFMASAIVVNALFEWLGEQDEKIDARRSAIDIADDDSVYWDSVADAVSDGEIPNPNDETSHIPAVSG